MDHATHLLRKAAILLDSLDGPTADVLCSQLAPEQASRVRQAAAQLESVEPLERQRVLEEFLRLHSAATSAAAAGVKLDDSLAARLAVVDEVPEEPVTACTPAATCFPRLQAASAETLASCFAGEHPQTITVLLAHLPASRAASVLKLLADDVQADVVQRLARLEATDADVLAEIERTLEQAWLSQAQTGATRPAGLAALEAMLDVSAGADRPALLELLEAADPHLARRLGYPQTAVRPGTTPERGTLERASDDGRRSTPAAGPAARAGRADSGLDLTMNTAPSGTLRRPGAAPATRWTAGNSAEALDFDDLLALDDAALARVFRAAEPQVALLALTGASPQMADRMLGQLAPREATGLARQMEALGPIRLQDVACAQQQLADLAWQLAKQGVISLPPARYLMEAV